MTTQSRFVFPGFAFKGVQDTLTHEVELGTIEDGGNVFVLTMIRNKQFTHLSFAVASISDAQGKPLWSFKPAAFDGYGVLAMAGDKPVITLIGRGKFGKVERVIPLYSLTAHKPIGLRERIQLKKSAAIFLDRDYLFSPIEEKMDAADRARIRAEQEAAEAAAEALRAQKREQRVRMMLARGQVTGYTADGKKRYGLPVLDSEWPSCSNGVNVMLVASIGENGEIGELIESFKVVKERGKNPEKGFPAFVTAEMPTAQASINMAVRPLRSTIIEKDGDAFEVQLFASMDQIREARKNGLNSGTFVAVDEVDSGGNILVYSVHSDNVDTVGKFLPLA